MIADNIHYYRLLAGLTQQQLANEIGVSKMAVSYYESGQRMPDSTIVIKMAKALHTDIADLLTIPSPSVEITHSAFRKQYDVSSTEIDMAYGTVDRYLSRVHEIVGIIGSAALPVVDLSVKLEFRDREDGGRALREYLHLPINGPVGNIVDCLENRGFVVCFLDFHSNEISGVNGTLDGRPFIAVNSHMPAARQRFTLIHELVHIVFRLDDVQNEEKTVDEIAGAFLLPKDDIVRELGVHRTNIKGELCSLQREYGISAQSILVRARQTGIISSAVYRDHYSWINDHVFATAESNILLPERETLFQNLVIRAVSEDMIGIDRAAELLGKTASQTRQICCGEG